MSHPRFVTLNNGVVMPTLGLGTWKSKPGEMKTAVLNAIDIGYRHLDCAWIYRNQNEVGEAIAESIAAGKITRSDLFITTKLWNNFHADGDVEAHCRDSLTQLGLDYVDLYLIHWPATGVTGETLTPSIRETWLAMERLVSLGLTRTIGVSNFTAKKLRAMQEYATIFPAVNQVELHPRWRQDGLLAACAELGVHLTAYSPLGSPDSADMAKHNGASVMENPVVVSIAEAVGRSPAQVCIKWALQRGTSVIPKSTNPARQASNLDVEGWDLTPEQFAAVNSLDSQERMIAGLFVLSPEGPYRTQAEFWDEV